MIKPVLGTPLWATDQLAEHLGVPVATIYAWRARGLGPRACRVGKHLRWRPDDVARWLESTADAQ